MPARFELSLSVQYGCQDERLPTRQQVRRWVRAAQEMPMQATVRFVAADEGRTLNRDYRGKDYATNVLSFVYASAPQAPADPEAPETPTAPEPPADLETLGDLAVCLPVVVREAEEQGKPVMAHMAHLIVHGMLHLQGYAHETNKHDAARMEVRECEILARLGFPDPYN